MAFQALLRNIMRSALTTLGIVIGVAAVIAMVEIGQGSKAAIARTIQSMGANNLLVMPGAASSGGVSFGGGSSPTLTPGDVEAISRECRPAVEHVAPIVRARTQVIYGNKNWVPVYIYGTTPAYLDVREWDLETGRIFSDQEVSGANEVCVLGQTVVRELFGDESPLGQVIRVNNYPLKVVGTLTRKGANTFGMDQDDIVMAPWRTIKFKVSGQSAATTNQSAPSSTDPTAQTNAASSDSSNRYPGQALPLYPARSAAQLADFPSALLPTNIDQIQVKAESEQEIKQAIRQITALLHERHKIRPGQADDFNI